MKKFVLTLIVIGLSLLMGCNTSDTPQPGPITNSKDIVGIWEIYGDYVQYNEDGTFHFASSLERLEDQPMAIGEFWFEEGQYFEKEIEVHNLPSCGSVLGIYEVILLENGNITFTKVEDECQARASSTTKEHKPVE